MDVIIRWGQDSGRTSPRARSRLRGDHALVSQVFDISDRVGWTRRRRAAWDRLKHLFLRDWSGVYDELRPFAMCDLTV